MVDQKQKEKSFQIMEILPLCCLTSYKTHENGLTYRVTPTCDSVDLIMTTMVFWSIVSTSERLTASHLN